MVPLADHSAPLSVTCTLVVQFRTDTAVEQGHLAGRVKHVSGDRRLTWKLWRCCGRSWHRYSAPSVSTPPSRNGHVWTKNRGGARGFPSRVDGVHM
jgi:hypothetical protein